MPELEPQLQGLQCLLEWLMFLTLVPCLPYPGGRGGGCLPFWKWWVLLLMGVLPPSWRLGVGQEWVGAFEGKGYIPHFP